MVGECRVKKIYYMLGALQMPFREPAFLPKGGDALILRLVELEFSIDSKFLG